jgi:hypothetical protein
MMPVNLLTRREASQDAVRARLAIHEGRKKKAEMD